MMKRKILILGSGFSSLSAASYLAQMGHHVEVFEKNHSLGGRARQQSVLHCEFRLVKALCAECLSDLQSDLCRHVYPREK